MPSMKNKMALQTKKVGNHWAIYTYYIFIHSLDASAENETLHGPTIVASAGC